MAISLNHQKLYAWLYYIIPALCFTPLLSSGIALGLGIILAFVSKNVQPFPTVKLTKYLLQSSIVMMGFGMSLLQVVETSKTSFYFTACSVGLTLMGGLLLGKLLNVEKNTSILIAGGTAICGGSAIAALTSIINPRNYQVTFSLTVIFILNSLALFIFPYVGHLLDLSQEVFGYWSAIAIHDTSSVVGAASGYGAKALEIATTVKLTRALWIIPVSVIILLMNKKEQKSRISIPWFIGLFLLAILLSHFLPEWGTTYSHLSWFGHKGMLVALFFIGTSLNKEDILRAGIKPFILGVLLWFAISVSSLLILT